MGDAKSFSPFLRVALKAVLTDTITDFSALHKAASCGATLPEKSLSTTEKTDASNPDTLLQELNKVFFETLIRFEKCRREDYIELEDGNFRKLSDDESMLRTFLEEVAKVIEILKLLLNEIEDRGTCNTLETQCDLKQASVDILVDLAESSIEKEDRIEDLRRRINVAAVEFAKEKELYFSALRRMRNEWQEGRQLAEMTIKYLKATYKQRAKVHAAACNANARQLIEETALLRKKIGQEKREFAECMTWLFTELDAEANRLRYLQGRNDVEELSKKLEKMEEDLAKETEEHTALKKEFAHCEAVVTEYRLEQEKKRLQEEYQHKMTICVLQVQCWWRTMIEIRGIKLKKKRGKGKGKKK
ncbi:unnamed protein product [Schistocephalus solidus]|uniref:Dynein regulatory complex protein 9 n=1 Tax=Schistocephalus solidus TaxID=70667 RepID=A0A183SHW0_SCHSO|nr:unnamed protein product [Schistocephalus solidus]